MDKNENICGAPSENKKARRLTLTAIVYFFALALCVTPLAMDAGGVFASTGGGGGSLPTTIAVLVWSAIGAISVIFAAIFILFAVTMRREKTSVE